MGSSVSSGCLQTESSDAMSPNTDDPLLAFTTCLEQKLLSSDDTKFDTELFHCWVTGEIADDEQWMFTLKIHIAMLSGHQQACYALEPIHYDIFTEIYASVYKAQHAYFPKAGLPPLLLKEHHFNSNAEQLRLLQKYITLDNVQWKPASTGNAGDEHLTLICDLLITLLNSPSFVTASAATCMFDRMQIRNKVQLQALIRGAAQQRKAYLTRLAKQRTGCDAISLCDRQQAWVNAEFHTVSLVQRENTTFSTHWALKFEGVDYLLTLELFDRNDVRYQILENRPLCHRVFWYSWITQYDFIKNWSENARIRLDKNVRFCELVGIAQKWKQQYQKYQAIENNCQHFARDVLSVFHTEAAKRLTDKFSNLFELVSGSTTLRQEIDRVDEISAILKAEWQKYVKQRAEIDGRPQNEVKLWLTKIGLSRYYRKFEQECIDQLMVVRNLNEEMIAEMVQDEEHQQLLMQEIRKLNGGVDIEQDIISNVTDDPIENLHTMSKAVVMEDENEEKGGAVEDGLIRERHGKLAKAYTNDQAGVAQFVGDLEELSEKDKKQIVAIFQEQDINVFRDLFSLTHDEMKEIGITKLGIRKKILRGIEKLSKQRKSKQ